MSTQVNVFMFSDSFRDSDIVCIKHHFNHYLAVLGRCYNYFSWGALFFLLADGGESR